MSNHRLEHLDLPTLINTLRGDVSFDDLAKAVENRVGSQTLQRFGDPKRPFPTPVRVESLIAAAQAINSATPQKTTPWALWVAHGISFERTHGLWGRPDDRVVGALGLLPPGWHDLAQDRLRSWVRTGAALVAEQRAAEQEDELRRLRAELAERDARIAELEANASSGGFARRRPKS